MDPERYKAVVKEKKLGGVSVGTRKSPQLEGDELELFRKMNTKRYANGNLILN